LSPPMHTSDFDYELPPELIAREPARPRDASRLMVLNRQTGRWIDSEFRRLLEFLKSSDVLVFNDTRVIRARMRGTLERLDGSTREVEVFFVFAENEITWEVLCRPGKRIHRGDRVILAEGELEGVFGDARAHGVRLLHVRSSIEKILETYGQVPLPPYINREPTESDAAEYQTVYAKAPGAVAAPTAGLHFTDSTFRALRDKQIEVVMITLHV